MKKIITLFCAIFCCLSVVLADEPDTKDTTVSYKVDENYEWSVPSTTEFAALATDQKLEDEVAVTKCLIANYKNLVISLDNAENVNGFILKLDEAEDADQLPYEISLTEGGEALAKGDIIVEVAPGQLIPLENGTYTNVTKNVYGKITGYPRKSGVHKDQITFVAEAKVDLTGYTWDSERIHSFWERQTGLYDEDEDWLIDVVMLSTVDGEYYYGMGVPDEISFNTPGWGLSADFGCGQVFNEDGYKEGAMSYMLPVTFISGDALYDASFAEWLDENGTLKKADIYDLTNYTVTLDSDKLAAWYNQHKTNGFSEIEIPYNPEAGFKLNIHAGENDYTSISNGPSLYMLNLNDGDDGITIYDALSEVIEEGYDTLEISGGKDAKNPWIINFFKKVGTITKTSE